MTRNGLERSLLSFSDVLFLVSVPTFPGSNWLPLPDTPYSHSLVFQTLGHSLILTGRTWCVNRSTSCYLLDRVGQTAFHVPRYLLPFILLKCGGVERKDRDKCFILHLQIGKVEEWKKWKLTNLLCFWGAQGAFVMGPRAYYWLCIQESLLAGLEKHMGSWG